MKLVIFGATGSVGKELVKQSLFNGHTITAFVRDPAKLEHLRNERLTIYMGDVRKPEEVENAITGHDAVLCALGDGKAGKIRAVGTSNIIEAMKSSGIRRLVCQTTLGMGESYGNLNFIWKHIMFGMLLRKAFKDHNLQENYVLKSGLDYTLVRPAALMDGALTNSYKIGFDGKYKALSLKISKADVADFMIRQLLDKAYVRKAVSISN
ncbi:NAD(P)-dependent oxidoreductase [Flavihumibacter sp. ZG627]|uniref:NAD(P)-dependent oxidoreductase n=1 Tax=Flavihumibacter sp. ZG627 TaxID=1463156 RepID=UPI000580498D|nr:SDR family oxidoreductase [Flavihumibacter sp. ZG627]KIC90950.1 epimerase [Flavihumibacter sp. ZG627]